MYSAKDQVSSWLFFSKREKRLILAIECDINHIHILLEYPKNIRMSYIVQKLEQETTCYIRKEYKYLNILYYNRNILWSNSYFATHWNCFYRNR